MFGLTRCGSLSECLPRLRTLQGAILASPSSRVVDLSDVREESCSPRELSDFPGEARVNTVGELADPIGLQCRQRRGTLQAYCSPPPYRPPDARHLPRMHILCCRSLPAARNRQSKYSQTA